MAPMRERMTRAGWDMKGWRPSSIERDLRYGSFLRCSAFDTLRLVSLLRSLLSRPRRSCSGL